MNFLDVKTDFAFKKVFGSEDSKDLLVNFLNAIITFEHNQHIQSLEIVDPYNIPMLKGMKDTFVDVKATLQNGSHVIIEMQVLSHEGFEKRILYNAAKKYSTQLKKGDDYHFLNPVIALTITDFELFPEHKDLISYFKLLDKNHLIEYSDDIELIFIELPKFSKTEQQLSSIQDKWIYFIKNAGSLEYIPKNMSGEIKQAFQIANEANFSEEELDLQHRKKAWIFIQKSSLELATRKGLEAGVEKGMKKGIEKGMEKGMEKGIEIMTINSYKAGLDINTISKITGLTEEKIQQIVKQK